MTQTTEGSIGGSLRLPCRSQRILRRMHVEAHPIRLSPLSPRSPCSGRDARAMTASLDAHMKKRRKEEQRQLEYAPSLAPQLERQQLLAGMRATFLRPGMDSVADDARIEFAVKEALEATAQILSRKSRWPRALGWLGDNMLYIPVIVSGLCVITILGEFNGARLPDGVSLGVGIGVGIVSGVIAHFGEQFVDRVRPGMVVYIVAILLAAGALSVSIAWAVLGLSAASSVNGTVAGLVAVAFLPLVALTADLGDRWTAAGLEAALRRGAPQSQLLLLLAHATVSADIQAEAVMRGGEPELPESLPDLDGLDAAPGTSAEVARTELVAQRDLWLDLSAGDELLALATRFAAPAVRKTFGGKPRRRSIDAHLRRSRADRVRSYINDCRWSLRSAEDEPEMASKARTMLGGAVVAIAECRWSYFRDPPKADGWNAPPATEHRRDRVGVVLSGALEFGLAAGALILTPGTLLQRLVIAAPFFVAGLASLRVIRSNESSALNDSLKVLGGK